MIKVGSKLHILKDYPQSSNLKAGQVVTVKSFPNNTTMLVTDNWLLETEYEGQLWEVVVDLPISSVQLTLPTDSEVRKGYPLYRGCLRYFPAALAGVAKISKAGNDKHNPGEELHHARGKSTDHGDCILRHLIDLNDLLAAKAPQETILNEVNQMAWRALALSQELHEQCGAPLAPGAKKPSSDKSEPKDKS